MIHRPARFPANAILVFSVTLLIAVGVWYTGTGGAKSTGGAVHFTQAEWQSTDAPDFSPPPTAFESRTLPGSRHYVTLPAQLPANTPRSTPTAPDIRTTWIRLSASGVRIPSGRLALYVSRIKTDGTIAMYVDGRLVQRAQQQGPLWNSLFTPLWVALDHGVGDAPLNEILIRIEHTPENPVALSSLWLGSADALRSRYYMRQWLQRELPATLSASFLAVGIFALFVWFSRRRETGYLLFFNLAATSFVGHLHYYVNLPITSDWFAWLTINSLFWLILVVHFYLCQMHGRPLRGLTWTLSGVILLITVLTLPVVAVLPVLPSTPVIIPLIYAAALVMAATVGLVGVLSAWRRSREARLVAVGVGICALLGVPDWMLYNNVINIEGWFLGAYTNAVTFGMFGLLMYRRYVNAISEFERMNANLAQRLKEREAELELSHQRLREAEHRQTISDERRRLMQDMHDGLGSSLISAIRLVETGDVSDVKVSQILKACLDDLKLTIDSMEPVEADLLLLLATLRFRLEPRLEGTGITLLWEVRELPTLFWLDPSSALHILRIVQESIANILHHTHASVIRMSTAVETAGVEVIIEDNGQGFDVETVLCTTSGRGLHNQMRRARALDGRATWHSEARGTRFTLWLPLERSAHAAQTST
ncbi:histidine kinase [Caballeronia mineralivorans PML1(12)]|uniref:Histidine kinase n=1 Tax=Caballeronia mineralivorans PML1(12) TaxID=908627 RepID=A0A0J1CM54_9BURK|nr:sensor histidine kinase [Caballeronia mineralivorans]KLU21875.1 histidine kinase [Caballeronia mineralivorans PML1(12)]